MFLNNLSIFLRYWNEECFSFLLMLEMDFPYLCNFWLDSDFNVFQAGVTAWPLIKLHLTDVRGRERRGKHLGLILKHGIPQPQPQKRRGSKFYVKKEPRFQLKETGILVSYLMYKIPRKVGRDAFVCMSWCQMRKQGVFMLETINLSYV